MLGFVLALAAVGLIVAVARVAIADPYLGARGGCVWSSDTDNSDELEFGNECGGLVAFEGGKRWDLEGAVGDYAIELGLEGAYRWKDLHGQNKDGDVEFKRKSADGETLHVGSGLAQLRACKPIGAGLELCLDGGFGYAYLDGLDDQAHTIAWQAGGEARYFFGDRFALIAGGRYFKLAREVSLDGNDTRADFYGAFGGVQVLDPFAFLEGE